MPDATVEPALPGDAPLDVPAQDVAPVSPIEPAAPVPVEAIPAPSVEDGDTASGNGLWVALGIALAAALGLMVAGLLRRRRRTDVFVEDTRLGDLAEPVAEPEPDLAPALAVAAEPPISHARPILALSFNPAVAGANDAVASVDYGLVVTNTGDAPASRVRMEARMFAMGQDHDAALAAFFADAPDRPTPIASAIPPGVDAALRAQVSLPRDAVNPIQVRDRVVFVPLVAFNVLYEYYDAQGGLQHGQTAMSYVVGRENRPPAEKMAPFRLDQGPRVYREVGQRVHQLKQVA